jgi:hypothetical protein
MIPGSGMKAIEAFVKKARNALSVVHEGKADEISKLSDDESSGELAPLSAHTPGGSVASASWGAITETRPSSQRQPNDMAAMLDRPWEEFLVLPGFAANELYLAKVKTIREAIIASQSGDLLSVSQFGEHSLHELRWAIRRIDQQLVSLCLEQSSSTVTYWT